jgi:hypothetical protein
MIVNHNKSLKILKGQSESVYRGTDKMTTRKKDKQRSTKHTHKTKDRVTVISDQVYVPLVVNTSRSFPHSRLITGFVTRLTSRVPAGLIR